MPNSIVFSANYDEEKVPAYKLQDPLKMKNGTPVKTTKEWKKNRRPEILNLFREHIYGHSKKKTKRTKIQSYSKRP